VNGTGIRLPRSDEIVLNPDAWMQREIVRCLDEQAAAFREIRGLLWDIRSILDPDAFYDETGRHSY